MLRSICKQSEECVEAGLSLTQTIELLDCTNVHPRDAPFTLHFALYCIPIKDDIAAEN